MKRKGFTLVEMLIVVVIIGILASALIPRLTGAQARARDSARQGHLNQISTALQTYFSDKGAYPGTGGETIMISEVSGELVPSYIKNIPQDPQQTRDVVALTTSDAGECETEQNDGNYGYAPIVRNGSSRAGMVIIANVEKPGSANWVNMEENPPVEADAPNLNIADGENKGCIQNTSGTSPENDLTTTTEGTALDQSMLRQGKIELDIGSQSDYEAMKAGTNSEMSYVLCQ